MKLTTLDLVRAYEYLRMHPPFSSWALPSHESVKFKVIRSKMQMGEYDVDPNTIMVSSNTNNNWLDVLETTAHEMVHLACEMKDHYRHPEHDYHFKRLSRQVCKKFGWDIKTF